MNTKNAFEDLIRDLSEKSYQYRLVKINGVIVKVNNTWVNAATLVQPLHRSMNVMEEDILDYGDVIIYKKNILFDNLLTLLNELRKAKKVYLKGLPTYIASKCFERNVYSHLDFYPSYYSTGGITFEWPSILYNTKDEEAKRLIQNFPSNRPLLSPDLPVYPNLEEAVEEVVGFPSRSTFYSQVTVIVPDYRARLKEITILSRNKVKVSIDFKEIEPTELLCKYYYRTIDKVCHGSLKFEKTETEKVIEFDQDIRVIYFYLITKKGSLLDSRTGMLEYLPPPGVKFKYTPENVKNLVLMGEGERLEFKRELPKNKVELAETIVAFANNRGGIIILGVDDNGRIVGVSNMKIKDTIYNIVRSYCDPPDIEMKIEEVRVNDKLVIIIEVKEGDNKPYLVKDRGVFIRAGATDRIASRAELDKFYSRQQLRI